MREHDGGWLHGDAHFIAFETENSFILVPRIDILKLVEQEVDFTQHVTDAREALRKLYHRREHPHELLTLMEVDKLRAIQWDEWHKPWALKAAQ